jgi:hypothetical protein
VFPFWLPLFSIIILCNGHHYPLRPSSLRWQGSNPWRLGLEPSAKNDLLFIFCRGRHFSQSVSSSGSLGRTRKADIVFRHMVKIWLIFETKSYCWFLFTKEYYCVFDSARNWWKLLRDHVNIKVFCLQKKNQFEFRWR